MVVFLLLWLKSYAFDYTTLYDLQPKSFDNYLNINTLPLSIQLIPRIYDISTCLSLIPLCTTNLQILDLLHVDYLWTDPKNRDGNTELPWQSSYLWIPQDLIKPVDLNTRPQTTWSSDNTWQYASYSTASHVLEYLTICQQLSGIPMSWILDNILAIWQHSYVYT